MATGDLAANLLEVVATKTSFADGAVVESASTPVGVIPVHAFDQTSIEYLDLHFRLEVNYAGGGVTLQLPWQSTVITATKVRWNASFRRHDFDAEDTDASFTYTTNAQSVSDDCPGTQGHVTQATIGFTSGTQMDSTVAGELFIIRLWRDPTHADDNMLADALLRSHAVRIIET